MGTKDTRRGAPDAKEKGEKAPDQNETAGVAQLSGKPAQGDARQASGSERQADATSPNVSVGSRPQRKATPVVSGRVTRIEHPSKDGRGFSIGKAIVVLGAWAFSRFRRGRYGSGRK
jgi:hypothetical protein